MRRARSGAAARWRCAVLALGLAAPALSAAAAEAGDAAALEAEIERARAEEAAEAAGLLEAEGAAGWALVVPVAWQAALQALTRDPAFQETSCAPSHAALADAAGDRIRHRRLTRADFRARRESRDLELAVAIDHAVTQAHVSTGFSCVARLRAEAPAPGRFAVWFDDLDYVAYLDPDASWWNPKAEANPEWVLRHEQLHFDLTELFARRQNAARERHAQSTRGVGDSPEAAVRDFAARWAEHMEALRDEWKALQDEYDRETRHGTVPKQQTAWFARLHRELATLPASAE